MANRRNVKNFNQNFWLAEILDGFFLLRNLI